MIDPSDLDGFLVEDDDDWPAQWRPTGPAYYLPQLPEITDEERAWKQRAACHDKDPAWFVDAVNSWEIRRAKMYCSACPVRAECLALADEIESKNAASEDLAGVWGGESPAERIARRGGRTARPPKVGGWRGRRGVQHGTNANYVAGCRCVDCTTAHAVAQADYRERRKQVSGVTSRGSTRTGPTCGTDSAYVGGCRCDRCRAAHAKSKREWKSKVRARQLAQQEGAA